ncbi:MAG: hypothetical protein WAN10_15275 [Candidatus Acidiferrales bacterium]
MQRIKSFDVFSVAKYASIFYVPMGLSYFEFLRFKTVEMATLPLGFYFAFIHFTVNLHVPAPQNWFGISLLVLLGGAGFAVTGWLTGLICALVYNFFAGKFRGLRIGVELE